MIEYSMYKENVLTGEMILNNKNESLLRDILRENEIFFIIAQRFVARL